MIESMTHRRTIRRYSQKEVTDELLNRLLEAASHTATMGNMQLYSVVVTRQEEMKKRLAPTHFNQPMVERSSVVLTFCADFHRFTEYCNQRDAKAGYDNLLSFMNATTDTLLFTQSFCTLAEDEGLGTCYLGTTIYNPMQIIDILNLPQLTFPVATITIGYPDENPAMADRLPLDSIIHQESYHEYTEEEINNIYSHKESLPENKQYIIENSKQNLAQVYTDVRYTGKDNEAMSEGMLKALKHQGFLK